MTSVRIGKSFSEEVADAVVRTAIATNNQARSVEDGRSGAPGPLYRAGSSREEEKTLGTQFIKSDGYRAWLDNFPDGGPSQNVTQFSPPVPVRTTLGGAGGFRAIVTSADASAGGLVPPEYLGLLLGGLVRPPGLLDLLNRVPVQSDAPEWVREASRVSAAAPVTEADQLAHVGDETATKPEGGIAWEKVVVPIITVAVWVPSTRRIVSDAPQLRELIDGYLEDEVRVELEDQIISGSGGAGFTGIFNTSGTQTLGPPGGGATELDLIRTAQRMIRVTARTDPTAVLAHPADVERWDLMKDADGDYLISDPTAGVGPRRLWGIPVVESDACPAGSALVGDFRKAVLFDREQTTISVGTADQDFIRNIVRVLAEARSGFTVMRPSAFVEVDLVA